MTLKHLAALSAIPNFVTPTDVLQAVKAKSWSGGAERDDANYLAAIFANRPDMVVDLAAPVLQAFCKHSTESRDREAVATALAAAVTQQGLTLESSALDGVTDLRMLAAFAEIPELLQPQHLEQALKDKTITDFQDGQALSKIYTNNAPLIRLTAGLALKALKKHSFGIGAGGVTSIATHCQARKASLPATPGMLWMVAMDSTFRVLWRHTRRQLHANEQPHPSATRPQPVARGRNRSGCEC